VINRRKGETTMPFTAMLSELYNAFRRRVGGDEAAAKAVAENRPFNGLKRELDQRYEALTQALYQVEVLSRATDQRLGAFGQTMEQRFDALRQRFDVLSQPFDELKRELDQRFDALSQAMDQRFDALSRRFDGLNQPFVELSRALQQRTDALNHSVNQRLDVLSRAMDERFAFGQTMDQRFDAFGHRLDAMSRTIDERFGTEAQRFEGMDVQLARLETNVARMWLEQQAEVAKAPTKFHYLEWTLGILLGLMLGFGAKVIFDWGVPTTLFRGLWQN
jgi:DNA anti-recombination protein RmuC